MGLGSGSGNSAQQIPESGYVGLGHLEGLVFGQLAIVSQTGKVLAETIEGLVEVLHPTTLTCIGGQATLPLHDGCDLLATPLLSRASGSGILVLTIGQVKGSIIAIEVLTATEEHEVLVILDAVIEQGGVVKVKVLELLRVEIH